MVAIATFIQIVLL